MEDKSTMLITRKILPILIQVRKLGDLVETNQVVIHVTSVVSKVIGQISVPIVIMLVIIKVSMEVLANKIVNQITEADSMVVQGA